MKVIQKRIIVGAEQYYLTHLNIINSVFTNKMTDTEVKVVASFLALDPKIIGIDTFNTYARKLVKDKLNMSAGSLSNHLGSLINKSFLAKDPVTNIISINQSIIPEEDWQGYQFRIIKKDE